MRSAKNRPGLFVLAIALLSGVVGFVGGIVWCLIEYPDSPQAPLFGMFFTGPAALILGFIVSMIVIRRAARLQRDGGHNAEQGAAGNSRPR